MVRLNSPRRNELSLEDFEKYPVWTWDDEKEGFLPISDIEPFGEDGNTYFIKAIFNTHGYVFDGYLIGNKTFYAFNLFIFEDKIGFNLNTPNLINQALNKIFEIMKCAPFEFFPIHYKSEINFKNWGQIFGTLKIKDKECS